VEGDRAATANLDAGRAKQDQCRHWRRNWPQQTHRRATACAWCAWSACPALQSWSLGSRLTGDRTWGRRGQRDCRISAAVNVSQGQKTSRDIATASWMPRSHVRMRLRAAKSRRTAIGPSLC